MLLVMDVGNTSQDDGGDRHRDEAAHQHLGQHLPHQEIVLLPVLRQCLGGLVREDVVGGKSVERGERERHGHRSGVAKQLAYQDRADQQARDAD